MFESDKKSSLDRVKKSLYSRGDSPQSAPRHGVHGSERGGVPLSWDDIEEEKRLEKAQKDAEQAEAEAERPKRSRTIRKAYKILFLSAATFFGVALLVAAFTMFGGKNFISVDNIDILVSGPVSVAGGEILNLNVSVVNKNTADIELVDLIVDYPAGTKAVGDQTKDLSQQRVSVGDIAPGAVAQKSVGSIMFGEEGSMKKVKFTVEYRTAGSNAIFFKEKEYTVKLSASPVLVSVDAPERILNGQSMTMNVTVSSNTSVTVQDLLLVLEYPFGFTVTSFNPAPAYANSVWRLGDLAPGTKKTITVSGSLQGQDGEERTVHAYVGIQDRSNEREIATNIISRDHIFTLERPSLGLDLTLDGTRGDVVLEPGRSVRADVIWTNNSSSRITDARIEVKLSGNAFDRNSVSVADGYYDSRNNAIIWEAGRVNGLDSIAPGDSGRVSFTFSSLRASPGTAISNPIVNVEANAAGERLDESGTSQDVTTAVSRSVKIVSNLSVTARSLRSQGPISNSGPVPPRAEQPTTYTVVWTVTNTSNSMSDAKVSAVAPAYVGFTDIVSPQGTSVTYDPMTGRVTWLAGDIPANADIGRGAKQVYFQLVVTPNLSHIGSAPEILGQTAIEGTDSFTGVTVKNTAPALTTRTMTDPLWKSGDETVVE